MNFAIMIHESSNLVLFQSRGGSVALAGDARFDSPGFSAKYATYYIQVSTKNRNVEKKKKNFILFKEMESKKIVALEVGMKDQVWSYDFTLYD